MIKGKKGFTLMEILVAIFISVVILGVIFTVSNVSSWSLQTGSTLLDIQWEASRGMNRMLEELYVAGESTMTVDASGDFVTFQVPTIDPINGTIYDINDQINWGDGTNDDCSIRYLVPAGANPNAGRLVRRLLDATNTVVANADIILANNINTISFTGYDTAGNIDYTHPNLLTISITVSKTTTQGRSLQTTLDSAVTFRNY